MDSILYFVLLGISCSSNDPDPDLDVVLGYVPIRLRVLDPCHPHVHVAPHDADPRAFLDLGPDLVLLFNQVPNRLQVPVPLPLRQVDPDRVAERAEVRSREHVYEQVPDWLHVLE
jgi:hypothetical protein